jgi:hypothetical protein
MGEAFGCVVLRCFSFSCRCPPRRSRGLKDMGGGAVVPPLGNNLAVTAVGTFVGSLRTFRRISTQPETTGEFSDGNPNDLFSCKYERDLVGAWRFELQTSCAQGRRATRLRYAPTSATSHSTAGCEFRLYCRCHLQCRHCRRIHPEAVTEGEELARVSCRRSTWKAKVR